MKPSVRTPHLVCLQPNSHSLPGTPSSLDGPAPPGSPVVVRLPGHGPARSARFGADYPEAERWLLSFAPEPLCIDCIRCEP
jgi:hypothetical protein